MYFTTKSKNEEYTNAAEAYLKCFYCNGIISIEQKGNSQHLCESIIFNKESGKGEPITMYYRR